MLALSSDSRRVLTIFILLEFFIVILACSLHGFTLSGLQATTRFSGRLSLFLFSIIFIFHARREVLVKWLSEEFYLLFAVVHGIHLIELLWYVSASGTQLIPYRVAGGFLAYAFIFVMPWVKVSVQRGTFTTKKFNTIEQIYLIYIWIIFFMSYLPRILGKLPNVGGTFAEHMTLFVWVMLLIALRFIVWFSTKNEKITRA